MGRLQQAMDENGRDFDTTGKIRRRTDARKGLTINPKTDAISFPKADQDARKLHLTWTLDTGALVETWFPKTGELPCGGGEVTFIFTGEHLHPMYLEDESGEIGGRTRGSDAKQTVTPDFPVNEKENEITYTLTTVGYSDTIRSP